MLYTSVYSPSTMSAVAARYCVSLSMRAGHPGLLSAWREQAVRTGQRTYRTTDGRDVRIGLGETCLGCHGEASKFCDRCHAQNAVTLSCWQCHPQSPIPRP